MFSIQGVHLYMCLGEIRGIVFPQTRNSRHLIWVLSLTVSFSNHLSVDLAKGSFLNHQKTARHMWFTSLRQTREGIFRLNQK